MSEETKKEKLHAGELRVVIEEEETIWTDRRRVTIFALPWSFTKYTLTPSRLIFSNGFLHKKEEEIRLYRIRDISFTQTLGERMNNTGTLQVYANDASSPILELRHIKDARRVKEVLSQSIEISRRANGVHASEVIGGPAGGPRHGAEHDAFGPDMAPDFNHNGIDDRTE